MTMSNNACLFAMMGGGSASFAFSEEKLLPSMASSWPSGIRSRSANQRLDDRQTSRAKHMALVCPIIEIVGGEGSYFGPLDRRGNVGRHGSVRLWDAWKRKPGECS